MFETIVQVDLVSVVNFLMLCHYNRHLDFLYASTHSQQFWLFSLLVKSLYLPIGNVMLWFNPRVPATGIKGHSFRCLTLSRREPCGQVVVPNSSHRSLQVFRAFLSSSDFSFTTSSISLVLLLWHGIFRRWLLLVVS